MASWAGGRAASACAIHCICTACDRLRHLVSGWVSRTFYNLPGKVPYIINVIYVYNKVMGMISVKIMLNSIND